MFRPFAIAVAALFPLWAATAWAQPAPARPDRPYRGLFQQGAPPEPGHLLAASGIALTGYDDNLRAEARGTSAGSGGGGVGGRNNALRGSVSTAMGGMTYTFVGESLQLWLTGGGVARYYPSLDDKFSSYTNAAGTLAYAASPWKGMTASMHLGASYRPYFFDSSFLFPGALDLGDPPLGSEEVPYVTNSFLIHNERIALAQRISRRTSVHATYGYRGTDRENKSDHAFARQSYGGALTHQLRRDVGLRAGYTLRETRYSSGRILPIHVIDVGANFNRTLSFSRRTTLSFGTGTTAMEREEDGVEELRFRIMGQALLTHEFGRTWTLYSQYHRGVLSSEVWDEPAEAEGVVVGLTGFLTRRLQMNLSARGVLGKVGLGEDAPGFDGLHGVAQFGYALNRYANLTFVYAYYQHNFEDGTPLRVDLPSTVGRQSVRVGVTLWAPVFQRVRRTDASG